MIFLKRKGKLHWKKFHQALKINNKKRIVVILKILDQIQQDNEDIRTGIEKSISTICKEEGISFEQVFYLLFSDAVFMSNKLSFGF